MNLAGRILTILGLLMSSPALAAGSDAAADSVAAAAIGKEYSGTAMTVAQKYPQAIPFISSPPRNLEAWLNLEELADVEIPENFSFAKKLGWSAGFLLHPVAYRSRVPIYSYKWGDVCFEPATNAGFLDRITTGSDLVPGAVDWTIHQGVDSVSWYNSIEQACMGGSEGRIEFAVNEAVDTLSAELMSYVDNENGFEKFLLTTVPLRNVGVIGEYIGVCDVQKIHAASGSVCQTTLGVPMLN
ncbi:MAG: hypothetical protein OXH76_00955 [Boseongicola sp.]|nr:hypothetical protein [Boseongicola sp.]